MRNGFSKDVLRCPPYPCKEFPAGYGMGDLIIEGIPVKSKDEAEITSLVISLLP